jgi:hypothetical protein
MSGADVGAGDAESDVGEGAGFPLTPFANEPGAATQVALDEPRVLAASAFRVSDVLPWHAPAHF